MSAACRGSYNVGASWAVSLTDEAGDDRLRHRRIAGIRLEQHNTELPLIAIVRLVNKTENAGGRAQPFRTILERPDRIGLRQSVQESLNEKIGDPVIIGLRGARLLVEKP